MIREAHHKVRSTPSNAFNKGCAAKFVNLGNGWGFKFYDFKLTRDETHRKQKRAAKYGLAPNVGHKSTFKLDGSIYYGYLTEVAAVIKDEFAKKMGVHPSMLYTLDGEEGRQMRACRDGAEEGYEYDTLVAALEKKGFDTYDMHWGNIGHMPDGRLVAIDFDCA